jgi:hypothetical protein
MDAAVQVREIKDVSLLPVHGAPAALLLNLRGKFFFLDQKQEGSPLLCFY